MSDWLDTFTMMGAGLNDSEKSLMRFAIKKEQERIIKLLEDAQVTEAELFDGTTIKVKCESVRADILIALIKGEQK